MEGRKFTVGKLLYQPKLSPPPKTRVWKGLETSSMSLLEFKEEKRRTRY
jgi:hypothetical protein